MLSDFDRSYKLVGKTPVLCSFEEAARADRKVCLDIFGEITVSTVFLSFDHAFGDSKPVLFETMIFGGEHDQYQERYYTYDEAVEGHKLACDLVNKLQIERENKLNDLGV